MQLVVVAGLSAAGGIVDAVARPAGSAETRVDGAVRQRPHQRVLRTVLERRDERKRRCRDHDASVRLDEDAVALLEEAAEGRGAVQAEQSQAESRHDLPGRIKPREQDAAAHAAIAPHPADDEAAVAIQHQRIGIQRLVAVRCLHVDQAIAIPSRVGRAIGEQLRHDEVRPVRVAAQSAQEDAAIRTQHHRAQLAQVVGCRYGDFDFASKPEPAVQRAIGKEAVDQPA